MATFNPYLSDDESEGRFGIADDFDEFEGSTNSDDGEEFFLSPEEYHVTHMGENEVDDDYADPESAYNLYFEQHDWCYYVQDDPVGLFDNLAMVCAANTLEKLRGLLSSNVSPEQRRVQVQALQTANDHFQALQRLREPAFDTVAAVVKDILAALPEASPLFNYLGWRTFQDNFSKDVPLEKVMHDAMLYAEYLDLPKNWPSEASSEASGSNRIHYAPSAEPTRPTELKHDTFSSTPVLLRIELIQPDMNREGLKGWLQSIGAPFDDVRVAYIQKASLGWAAVKVADKEQRAKAVQVLQDHVQVTELLDVDSSERDPLKKAAKAKSAAVSPPPTVSAKGIAQQAHEAMLSRVATFLREVGVDQVPLYFIDFELACTLHEKAIPNELAIIRCTLRKGESQHLHHFIHPGALPAELCRTAAFISFHISGIPYKNFAPFNRDYASIWKELQDFVEPGALVVAKGKDAEEKALQWLCDRAEGLHKDALGWLKERPGPLHGIGIVDYTDLLEVLRCMEQAAFPAGNEQPTPQDAEEANGEGTSPSGPSKIHRRYQLPHHRCDYHQEMLSEDGGESWHCALCDARSYLSAVRAMVNQEYPSLVVDRLPCEDVQLV
eukprot:GGOE01062085.1.p1 GENE.GGOE01062085.1~~GGOE01062085.1.p1  ORF type:complete len:616 (+),score=136.95 GGOE01062085.1:23-1849(+)